MEVGTVLVLLGAPAGFLVGALLRGATPRRALLGAGGIVIAGAVGGRILVAVFGIAERAFGAETTMWTLLWGLSAFVASLIGLILIRQLRKPRRIGRSRSPFDLT